LSVADVDFHDRYAYCRYNPFKWTDPSGEDPNGFNNSLVGPDEPYQPYYQIKSFSRMIMDEDPGYNQWMTYIWFRGLQEPRMKDFFIMDFEMGSGGSGSSEIGPVVRSRKDVPSKIDDFRTNLAPRIITVAGTTNYFMAINNRKQIIQNGNDIFRNFNLSSFNSNQPMKYMKYIRKGGRVNKVNNFKNIVSKGKYIAKAGKYFNYVGIGLTGTNFAFSDQSWGDIAELTVGLTSIGFTMTNKYLAPVGLGIAAIDFFDGFDDYYQFLDLQEKLYDAGFPAVIGWHTIGGAPIFIQKD